MLKVSILGDSISTYDGYNPIGYKVFYDEVQRYRNGLSNVNETWWAKVINHFGVQLCSDDAYSGSRVAGYKFPAANSDERIAALKHTDNPDLILIYIGYNDYGFGVPITNPNQNIDVAYFEDAYNVMLEKIKYRYPNATIVCATLLRSKLKDDDEWEFPEYFGGFPFSEYNNIIRKVALKNNCSLADLEQQNVRYETLDGSHPTANGHKTIAYAWEKALTEIFEYSHSKTL